MTVLMRMLAAACAALFLAISGQLAAQEVPDAALAACEAGEAEACNEAGEAYYGGFGAPRIVAIARQLYEEGCEGGSAEACLNLGNLQASEGENARLDLAQANYERACSLGLQEGCAELASQLGRVGAPPADHQRSMALAREACRSGYEPACEMVLRFLQDETRSDRDLDEARAILDRQCRAGDAESCNDAARIASQPEVADEVATTQYLMLGCDAGDGWQCDASARRHHAGLGAQPSRAAAEAQMEKACALDEYIHCRTLETFRSVGSNEQRCLAQDQEGCIAFGRDLLQYNAIVADPSRGTQLLGDACLAGRTEVCIEAATAVIFQTEDEPVGGRDWAGRIVEAGCAAGDETACRELAHQLVDGDRWFAPDLPRGVALLGELCEDGSSSACERRSDFAGLFPDIPIEAANEEYVAPYDPDDETHPINVEKRAEQDVKLESCVTHRATFRGREYAEDECIPLGRSIGGYRTKPGEAPWQALLWRPKVLNGTTLTEAQRVQCGGTLVATGWVLTAAHCLIDNGVHVMRGQHRIRLGVNNPQANEGVSYPILRTIRHPDYSSANDYIYDIALVQYDHRAPDAGATRQEIRTLPLDPLAVEQRPITDGTKVVSFGWGWTAVERSGSTDYLQGVRMVLRNAAACTRLTGFTGDDLHAALCAGGRQGQQTCFGDSGGPLVTYGPSGRNPVLIGVVSAGKKCGTTGQPSRYTRVAKVRDWFSQYLPASALR